MVAYLVDTLPEGTLVLVCFGEGVELLKTAEGKLSLKTSGLVDLSEDQLGSTVLDRELLS